MNKVKSQSTIYKIPVRRIVANTNPRNPLSKELQEAGYCTFPEEGKVALWPLAISEDASQRAQFVKAVKDHDAEITALAGNLLALGLLQPVEVRDNGSKKEGDSSYTLVFGARRCLATLFNWCVLGKPAEPVIEAQLTKGNEATLLQHAIAENTRLQPNAVEEARAFQLLRNAGLTNADIASSQGVTTQTVRNRLALLELPVEQQKRIEAGRLTATKALEGKNGDGEEKPKAPRPRSRKAVEEAMNEFAEDRKEHKVLAWVLGRREDF